MWLHAFRQGGADRGVGMADGLAPEQFKAGAWSVQMVHRPPAVINTALEKNAEGLVIKHRTPPTRPHQMTGAAPARWKSEGWGDRGTDPTRPSVRVGLP